MKGIKKKIISGILFLCLVLVNTPIDIAFGEVNGYAETEIIVENQEEENQEEENQEEENQVDEFNTQNVEQNQPEEQIEEGLLNDFSSVVGDQKKEEDLNEQIVDDKNNVSIQYGNLNYIYIESPYIQPPDTQRIVLSFDEEMANVNAVFLTVEDENGNQEKWDLKQQEGKLYLFEKELVSNTSTGVYKVVNVLISNSESEKRIDLNDIGVKAEFGVNVQYEGIEELQLVEGQLNNQDTSITSSVVTIDENGVAAAKDSIAEALDSVETNNKESGNRLYKSVKSDSSDIVVALDPGHDAKDAGAQGHGLREEVLTLKIANYCKQELEQYEGVSVYMTRTTAACPYNKPGITCMEDRVKAAAKAGAQIFVSFHLNSSVSTSAHGAEVIVPNNSWKEEVGASGRQLGNAILDELVALGLTRRSVYSKDTTINEKYPDGSVSDYFSVQIYCKEQGIPGLIVEHAFLSNANDVNNFLKTESGLKKLGVADATGIAKHLGLKKLGERKTIPEGTYMIDSVLASGKGLKIEGGVFASGAGTVLSTKQGNVSSQRFEVVSVGDGYYNIIAEHSGKALQLVGSNIEQRERDSKLKAQKWSFIDAGNGSYYIMSFNNTCIDVKSAITSEGNTIWTYTPNKTNAQKWKLEKADFPIIEDGIYTIHNAVNKDLVLTVSKGSLNNFGNIEMGECKAISAQRFEITYVGNGYYKVIAEHSGKSLDVSNGSEKNGTNLQQYTWSDCNAQLWKFIKGEDDSFFIRSKVGTAISLNVSHITSGTNVCMEYLSGKKAQKWVLKKENESPVRDGRYIISNAYMPSMVMGTENQNVFLSTYLGIKEQCFDVKYQGNGYYKIVSAYSGKSLDVFYGSASAGTNLWEHTWNGSNAQLWKFIVNADGSYSIKSKLGTFIDLDSGKTSHGTNIQMFTGNGTNAQKWKLVKADNLLEEKPLENGTYTILNMSNVSQTLDVEGARETKGANIQVYTSNNTSAQRFELYYMGNGYYQIASEKSGKSLDVANGSKNNKTNVWQHTWNGSDAQLWRIIPSSDGSYYIQSKLGTFLSINGNSALAGMNVLTNQLEGGVNQRWKFTKSSYRPVKDGKYTLRPSKYSNYAVDINNGSKVEGSNVRLYYYNGDKQQQLNISYERDGYYKIFLEHSKKSLTVENDSRQSGVNVIQKEWKGLDTQLWKFVVTDGGYYIRSKVGTVLDVYNGKFVANSNIWSCAVNSTMAQKWKVEKEYVGEIIDEGTYTIQTSLSQEKVIDISNGSQAECANAWIYKVNNTNAQKFSIKAVSDGYYKIESEVSGKVLDVANGSRYGGANVWQHTWNGSDAQLWRFIDAGNNNYYIQSKLGTVLDVVGASVTSGTNVQAYTLNKSKAQKWKLLKESEPLYRIMGNGEVTVFQMASFFKDRARNSYPYSNVKEAPTIEEFCKIYKEECEMEGVKTEVAFAQAMMETGFLKFGGDVKKEQYNFAGLGAVGEGASGASFPTIRMGIRAQVQHLKAYASSTALNLPVVDPRFNYVKRGSAEYVQWLGQKENPGGYGWATAPNYGYNIVKLYIIPMISY